MLEKLVIILIILNVLIIMFARYFSPYGSGKGNPAQRQMPMPQYDVNEFNAYFGYMMLHQFEESGARFVINCVLPNYDEPIDMIMISKGGVYVFEYVKAQGWISGTEGNDRWRQRIPMGGGRKPLESMIDNPVKSLDTKAHMMRKLLKHDGMVVRTIAVFPDFCLLNNIKVFNPHTRIVLLNQLVPTVVNLNVRAGMQLTQRDINELYDYLIQFEVIDEENEESDEVQYEQL